MGGASDIAKANRGKGNNMKVEYEKIANSITIKASIEFDEMNEEVRDLIKMLNFPTYGSPKEIVRVTRDDKPKAPSEVKPLPTRPPKIAQNSRWWEW